MKIVLLDVHKQKVVQTSISILTLRLRCIRLVCPPPKPSELWQFKSIHVPVVIHSSSKFISNKFIIIY